jgi:hypothetical protein
MLLPELTRAHFDTHKRRQPTVHQRNCWRHLAVRCDDRRMRDTTYTLCSRNPLKLAANQRRIVRLLPRPVFLHVDVTSFPHKRPPTSPVKNPDAIHVRRSL